MTTDIAWALGILGAILIREIYAHLPAVSRRLILREAAKLPSHVRDRHVEEWLQGNRAMTGSLTQLIDALGYLVCGTAHKMACEIRDIELRNIDDELARCASLQATNVSLLTESMGRMVEVEASAEKARSKASRVNAEVGAMIDKAKHGVSQEVSVALLDVQARSDELSRNIQKALLVLHDNTREQLSSAKVEIEEQGRLVNAASIKRAAIAKLIERTQGYPEDVVRGIEEIRHALALITTSSGDPQEEKIANARSAQSAAICTAIRKLTATFN